jgi:hypothetical protein
MKITSRQAIEKPISGTSSKKEPKASGIQYFGNFNTTLVDPILIIQSPGQGIYIILDFSRYPLFQNTLLDNYSIIYLVNSKNLIDSGTFIKAKIDNYIEAGITSLLITEYSIRIIKNIVNRPSGPYTKDLILYNIIVIKRFYINIVSETRLAEKKAWYYKYNLIVRLGDCKENIVLI